MTQSYFKCVVECYTMHLLNFQNLYFKGMASRMGLQDNQYIYIYMHLQKPNVEKYKIMPNDALYVKSIEIFLGVTLEIKNKLNIDFLFHLVQCFKIFHPSHIYIKLFTF